MSSYFASGAGAAGGGGFVVSLGAAGSGGGFESASASGAGPGGGRLYVALCDSLEARLEGRMSGLEGRLSCGGGPGGGGGFPSGVGGFGGFGGGWLGSIGDAGGVVSGGRGNSLEDICSASLLELFTLAASTFSPSSDTTFRRIGSGGAGGASGGGSGFARIEDLSPALPPLLCLDDPFRDNIFEIRRISLLRN